MGDGVLRRYGTALSQRVQDLAACVYPNRSGKPMPRQALARDRDGWASTGVCDCCGTADAGTRSTTRRLNRVEQATTQLVTVFPQSARALWRGIGLLNWALCVSARDALRGISYASSDCVSREINRRR